MTKTIVTLALMLYSLSRLITIAFYVYYDLTTLPPSVYVITVLCAGTCLVLAAVCWLRRLSGKKLRMLLLLNALCACVNMLIVYFDSTRSLTNWDMLVSGTLFDVLFFLGCCTIKLRDTVYQPGKTPYSRLGAKNNYKRLSGRGTSPEPQPEPSPEESGEESRQEFAADVNDRRDPGTEKYAQETDDGEKAEPEEHQPEEGEKEEARNLGGNVEEEGGSEERDRES